MKKIKVGKYEYYARRDVDKILNEPWRKYHRTLRSMSRNMGAMKIKSWIGIHSTALRDERLSIRRTVDYDILYPTKAVEYYKELKLVGPPKMSTWIKYRRSERLYGHQAIEQLLVSSIKQEIREKDKKRKQQNWRL